MMDPMRMWRELHDPDDIERERSIRADQRRLDFRELQATARDLLFLIERLEDPKTDERKKAETIDRIRVHTRRLITISERRAAA